MEIKTKDVLKRMGDLERDLMHLVEEPKQKPSLFGCVRGGDITEVMIGEAKKKLRVTRAICHSGDICCSCEMREKRYII